MQWRELKRTRPESGTQQTPDSAAWRPTASTYRLLQREATRRATHRTAAAAPRTSPDQPFPRRKTISSISPTNRLWGDQDPAFQGDRRTWLVLSLSLHEDNPTPPASENAAAEGRPQKCSVWGFMSPPSRGSSERSREESTTCTEVAALGSPQWPPLQMPTSLSVT